MPTPMRNDFSSASIGLTLPGQHKNLAKLHEWLVDELGISAGERVVALTNYQQGKFGRLPSHILLVTTARVAFTHDGGMRSIPIDEIDTSRIGLKAGIVNGDITLLLRNGEQLTFRRGMSLGMQEVATALQASSGGWSPEPTSSHRQTAPTPSAPAPPAPPQAEPGPGTWHGRGDDVIQFGEALPGLHLFRIRGGSNMEAFSVWALSSALQPQELLVNTATHYEGVVTAGMQGPLSGLQINSEGGWSIEPLDPSNLPVFDGSLTGSGDAAVFLRDGLEMIDAAKVLRVEANSAGTVSVWAYGSAPALLVNTIGSYAGTVVVPQGTQFLAVGCDGYWSLAG